MHMKTCMYLVLKQEAAKKATSKNIIPTEINPSDINSIARHCNDMNILPSKIQFSSAVVYSASNNFHLNIQLLKIQI